MSTEKRRFEQTQTLTVQNMNKKAKNAEGETFMRNHSALFFKKTTILKNRNKKVIPRQKSNSNKLMNGKITQYPITHAIFYIVNEHLLHSLHLHI